MGRLLLLWLLAGETAVGPSAEPAGNRYQFAQTEMAVPIKIVLYAPDNATASRAAEAAFSRFHDAEFHLQRLRSGKRITPTLPHLLGRARRPGQRGFVAGSRARPGTLAALGRAPST